MSIVTMLRSSLTRFAAKSMISNHHVHHRIRNNNNNNQYYRSTMMMMMSMDSRDSPFQRDKSSGQDNEDAKFYQFQTPNEEKKFEFVRDVFDNVAHNYDVMNDVMSAGIHRIWKRYLIEKLDPYPGTRLLDVAGGTGDIAFEFLRYTSKRGDDESSVMICDINRNMMAVGERRSRQLGLDHPDRLRWKHGDGLSLPFEDNSFDAYTVAFGIRNMVNLSAALDQAYRVLKPGGIFMCMEFSQVDNRILRSFYDWYSYQMIPVIGEVVSNDFKSYQYLVESIRKFPDQETFKRMIENAGFKFVDYENLSCGIAAIHTGYKAL